MGRAGLARSRRIGPPECLRQAAYRDKPAWRSPMTGSPALPKSFPFFCTWSTTVTRARDPARGRGGAQPVGRYPPFFSWVSTCFATAFSVSKTPTPVGAMAGYEGTLRGLSARCSSSTLTALGRSRLLYCTT